MKKFKCSVCGYVYEGNEPPERCPVCFQPGDMFIELEPEGDGKRALKRVRIPLYLLMMQERQSRISVMIRIS